MTVGSTMIVIQSNQAFKVTEEEFSLTDILCDTLFVSSFKLGMFKNSHIMRNEQVNIHLHLQLT